MRFPPQNPQGQGYLYQPERCQGGVLPDGDHGVCDGEEGMDCRFHPSGARGVHRQAGDRAGRDHAAAGTDFRSHLSEVLDDRRVLRLFQQLFLRFQ